MVVIKSCSNYVFRGDSDINCSGYWKAGFGYFMQVILDSTRGLKNWWFSRRWIAQLSNLYLRYQTRIFRLLHSLYIPGHAIFKPPYCLLSRDGDELVVSIATKHRAFKNQAGQFLDSSEGKEKAASFQFQIAPGLTTRPVPRKHQGQSLAYLRNAPSSQTLASVIARNNRCNLPNHSQQALHSPRGENERVLPSKWRLTALPLSVSVRVHIPRHGIWRVYTYLFGFPPSEITFPTTTNKHYKVNWKWNRNW